MTGVAQMQNKKCFGQWTDVFPQQSTETQSMLFVKKLLAVSISNIAYLRAIFPESAFGDRALEDLHLKILRDDSKCPGASQVIKWVRGCFDALEKKYLRQIILGIYVDPTKEDTLIESYTFRFSYENEGSLSLFRNGEHIASARSLTETKKATVSLLRTLLLLMQSLHPLPDDVLLTMKLLYYDKVTPPDYEPEGFKPTKLDYFLYDTETANLTIGKVETPFHQMRLNVKTDAKQFNIKEDPIPDKVEDKFSTLIQQTKKHGQEVPSIVPETQDCRGLENILESIDNSSSGNDFTTLVLPRTESLDLDKDSLPKPMETNLKNTKSKPANKTKSNKLGLSKSKTLCSSKPGYLEADLDETEILTQKTSKLNVSIETKGNKSKKIEQKINKCDTDSMQKERGVKRVTSIGNQEFEFELEMMPESQEIPSQEHRRRSKRKKVSTANKPLLV